MKPTDKHNTPLSNTLSSVDNRLNLVMNDIAKLQDKIKGVPDAINETDAAFVAGQAYQLAGEIGELIKIMGQELLDERFQLDALKAQVESPEKKGPSLKERAFELLLNPSDAILAAGYDVHPYGSTSLTMKRMSAMVEKAISEVENE